MNSHARFAHHHHHLFGWHFDRTGHWTERSLPRARIGIWLAVAVLTLLLLAAAFERFQGDSRPAVFPLPAPAPALLQDNLAGPWAPAAAEIDAIATTPAIATSVPGSALVAGRRPLFSLPPVVIHVKFPRPLPQRH